MSLFNFLKFFTSEHIGAHLPPCCLGHVGVTTFPSYTLTPLKFELIPAKSKTFQNLWTRSLNPTCSINHYSFFFSLSQLLVTKLVSFEVSWIGISPSLLLGINYTIPFFINQNFFLTLYIVKNLWENYTPIPWNLGNWHSIPNLQT